MSRYARDTIHAIILAGGRSSRMGFDKARLEINGETLLDRLVRLLSPLFNGILISASSNTSLTNNALRHVIDEQPDRGPLMAIYSCLKASPSNINFVIACDIPEVDIALIQKLLFYANEHDIVVPSFSTGLTEPLFAFYNRSILPVIQRQIAVNRLKISDCFPLCNTRIVMTSDPGWYRNLNTPIQFDAYKNNVQVKLA